MAYALPCFTATCLIFNLCCFIALALLHKQSVLHLFMVDICPAYYKPWLPFSLISQNLMFIRGPFTTVLCAVGPLICRANIHKLHSTNSGHRIMRFVELKSLILPNMLTLESKQAVNKVLECCVYANTTFI